MIQHRVIAVTYRDVPSAQEKLAAEGLDGWQVRWLDWLPGLQRIKAGVFPGRFGYPDLYITHLDFNLLSDAQGTGNHYVVLFTAYTEKPVSERDGQKLMTEAFRRAGDWLRGQTS